MTSEARALSWWDTLRVQLYLSIPAFLLGIVVPNRVFVRLATRSGAGRSAMRFLRALSDKYACDHLWTWFPVRRTLIVFEPATIERVLASRGNAPDPVLKKRAISRFAPGALVISNRDEARARRPFNTAALDLGRLHRHADTFAAIASAEVHRLTDERTGHLRWADFQWLGERISHQIILGSGCVRPALTTRLRRMLRLSNLLLRDVMSYSAFYETIDRMLTSEETLLSRDCLMHAAARSIGDGEGSDTKRVASQVAFWFFVLKDAIELHVARTLALLAAHPDIQARVRDEVRAAGPLTAVAIDGLRYLEACIGEQLRLWTPVPVLLRRAEQPFELDGIAVDVEQQILIHAGFYHRDRRVFGDLADTFWPDPDAAASPARYVFSAHERDCAGRSLVTFVLKAILASFLARRRFELGRPVIQPGRIPYLYDHFGIELRTVAGA